MSAMTSASARQLLMFTTRIDRSAASALTSVAPSPDLETNTAMVTLCALEAEGALRPGQVQHMTGLSSGGVSKMLDRLEQHGVLKRAYGGVAGDNRGVLVKLTPKGRTLVERFGEAMVERLPGVDELSAGFNRLLRG
jgi:DNA-binding MarR family transcriptional regulator